MTVLESDSPHSRTQARLSKDSPIDNLKVSFSVPFISYSGSDLGDVKLVLLEIMWYSCLSSQGTPQECYANLTLKAPRVQSGHNSPQIQYSDIIQVQDLPESEREDEGCPEDASVVSDLYASVQTHRVKTLDSAGEGEGYANHL